MKTVRRKDRRVHLAHAVTIGLSTLTDKIHSKKVSMTMNVDEVVR